MSKMSELSMVLQELKKCGESLVSISEELVEIFSDSGETKEKKVEKEKTAKKEPTSKEKGAEKQYSLTEVRAVLAEKSRAGCTAAVKELLKKHGADKLSDIDPSAYAALVVDVEVLGND